MNREEFEQARIICEEIEAIEVELVEMNKPGPKRPDVEAMPLTDAGKRVEQRNRMVLDLKHEGARNALIEARATRARTLRDEFGVDLGIIEAV